LKAAEQVRETVNCTVPYSEFKDLIGKVKTQGSSIQDQAARMKVLQQTVESTKEDLMARMVGAERKFEEASGEVARRMVGAEGKIEEASLEVARRMAAVTPLTSKQEQLEHRLGELGDLMDTESRERVSELQGMERRWQGILERTEDRLEERMDEKMDERIEGKVEKWEMKWDAQVKELDSKWEWNFERRMEDAMARLAIDIEKTPWAQRVDRREREYQAEFQRALLERPTFEEVKVSYTSNSLTERMMQQMERMQAVTAEQHQSLQAGLYTVERLLLQRLLGGHAQVRCMFM
jgi:hypothetical protein